MKYDEFAFFNQQLGTMLRDGIPLEGALKQLSAGMRRGELRHQLEQLQASLQSGVSLENAIAPRALPEFYKQMLRVGVQGNDLPGVLLLLADYYQRADNVWTRLKGLMVYPLIILAGAFGLSCFFTYLSLHLVASNFPELTSLKLPAVAVINTWVPPLMIGLLLVTFLVVLFVPAVNRNLRWRLPAFKEAKLAQTASTLGLMLKSGGQLGPALGLAQELERDTAAGRELAHWKSRLEAGHGKFADMAVPGQAFPPLFLWLVANAGEDIVTGFGRAAEVYTARALYRVELFLYAALPCSILALGMMIICQLVPLLSVLTTWMNALGNSDA